MATRFSFQPLSVKQHVSGHHGPGFLDQKQPMIAAIKFPANDIPALLVAVSFAAGLNVYATIATLGLLARSGVIGLPPGLQVVESWYVIAASTALFGVEFFADKIPGFDLIWNALHTFVRVPVAALVAWRATAQLPPGEQLIAAVLGALIALAAHGGKTAVRAAVTPSPEPVSNISLSLGEDAIAIGLTWFASRHPYVAAAVVIWLLIVIFVAVRWVIRALRTLFRGAEKQVAT